MIVDFAIGLVILVLIVSVLFCAAIGIAFARELCRVALARLMRLHIRRVASRSPERRARLAAHIFDRFPDRLYALSFAPLGIHAVVLWGLFFPGVSTFAGLCVVSIPIIITAVLLRLNEHASVTNLHPAGLYLYALEKLPGIPEHLQRQYLVIVFAIMRTRHSHLFPRWLILARTIFTPAELSGLLAARIYRGETDHILPLAFEALVVCDDSTARYLFSLLSVSYCRHLGLEKRQFTGFSFAAQLALSGRYIATRYGKLAVLKQAPFRPSSISLNLWSKTPLLLPDTYSFDEANKGAPYQPWPKTVQDARARLAPQKPVRKAYTPVKEDLLSAAHLPIVPRVLNELAETCGPEILPRLSRFRKTLTEIAQTGKRRDPALVHAIEETSRAMDQIAGRHAPLMSSWPGVFCASTWRRGQLVEGSDYAYVVSPATGKADTLVGSVTEVVGVIGAETFFDLNDGRAFVSVWDEANKTVRHAEIDRLEIRGGASLHYDWALHAFAENWENLNGRAFDLPVDLTGAPELDENSRRLLARFAEAAAEK